MKKHSCLPGCTTGLGSVCGTSIDLNELNFAPSQNHLLYTDKVYSKGHGTACPLVFNITTTPAAFQTQLLTAPMTQKNENLCEEIFGRDCGCRHDCNNGCGCNNGCNNGCGCNNSSNNCCVNCCNTAGTCQLDANAVFKIIKSYVRVRSFDTTSVCGLAPAQVTIDGTPVDDLICQGGSYEAAIRQNTADITKRICSERGLPTKAFFLITDAGPWSYQADFVLEGTVTTNGDTCCFRATFSTITRADIPNSLSNLAVPKISIPCVSGGIAPRLLFSFSGKLNLLNPEITVLENGDNNLLLVLNSAVAAEPEVNVEVVKKSLFCINACEALFPCEGTEDYVESDADDDDCLYQPDCSCCSPVSRSSRGCGVVDSVRGSTCTGDTNCEKISDETENSNCGNTIAFGTNSSCSSCCTGY